MRGSDLKVRIREGGLKMKRLKREGFKGLFFV
jgi:hypothetical protein